MYTHYRIEESAGPYYFPWVGLYTCEEDARREMDRVVNSGRANSIRLRIVRYEQTGWAPAERVEVLA